MTHRAAEIDANRKTIIDRSDAAARAAKAGFWKTVELEASHIRSLAERNVMLELEEQAERPLRKR